MQSSFLSIYSHFSEYFKAKTPKSNYYNNIFFISADIDINEHFLLLLYNFFSGMDAE